MDADTNTHDITSFLERALEEVIEVIMNFGQYPQPTFDRYGLKQAVVKQFDLYDFLESQDRVIEFADLLEYFILSMQDRSGLSKFSDSANRWEKRIISMLQDHLRGSALVQDVAAELEREDREDH